MLQAVVNLPLQGDCLWLGWGYTPTPITHTTPAR